MNRDVLHDNFRLRFQGDEPIEWGVNRFPDGQIQFKAMWDERFQTSGIEMSCSLNSSEALDLFLQIIHTVQIARCRIVYLYGARSDKSRAGDMQVCNVPSMFFRILQTTLANPLDRVPSATSYEIVAPHCLQLLKDFQFPEDQVRPIFPMHDELLAGTKHDLWIFPDASAKQRYEQLLPKGMRHVTCAKVRDQVTGSITKHEIPDLNAASSPLVVDDLCDGGATFIDVANAARSGGCGPLDLYITHGLFSKTVAPLLNCYSTIYTTDSLGSAVAAQESHPQRVKLLPVWG